MGDNIEINKTELLNQVTEEIVNGESYIQVKFTMPTIPPKVLDEIVDKYFKNKDISLGDFMEKVIEYASKNVEYIPILNINGKNVSIADKMIVLALAQDMVESELVKTCKKLNNGEVDLND